MPNKIKKEDSVLKKKKIKPWHRSAVQIFFFALVALISLNRFLKGYNIAIPFLSTASLHAICPFGGVVSIYTFFYRRDFHSENT